MSVFIQPSTVQGRDRQIANQNRQEVLTHIAISTSDKTNGEFNLRDQFAKYCKCINLGWLKRVPNRDNIMQVKHFLQRLV